MIYEERCYTLQPAHFRRFLAVFEAEGLDMILEHLGQLVGYFATETARSTPWCTSGRTRIWRTGNSGATPSGTTPGGRPMRRR